MGCSELAQFEYSLWGGSFWEILFIWPIFCKITFCHIWLYVLKKSETVKLCKHNRETLPLWWILLIPLGGVAHMVEVRMILVVFSNINSLYLPKRSIRNVRFSNVWNRRRAFDRYGDVRVYSSCYESKTNVYVISDTSRLQILQMIFLPIVMYERVLVPSAHMMRGIDQTSYHSRRKYKQSK